MYAEQGLEYEDCGSVASRKAASLAEEVYFPLKILMDMITPMYYFTYSP